MTVDITSFDVDGYVRLEWETDVRDADFLSWRGYRSPAGEGTWTLIGESAQADDLTANMLDFAAASATEYDYIIIQVKLLAGVEVESDKSAYQTVIPEGSTYWLIDPTVQGVTYAAWVADPGVSAPLYHVTADPFSEEYEEQTIKLIGRGNKRDVGTRWGYAGTLTAQLRGFGGSTARTERLSVESIRAAATSMYLRNPFGDVFLVNVGEIKATRIAGTGTTEYLDIQVPYQETVV